MIVDDFKKIHPLFLLGIARSGTTLLQSLLDGHPELLVDVADSHFYGWYKRYYRWTETFASHGDSFDKRIETAEAAMVSYIFDESSLYYQDFLSDLVPIAALKRRFRDLIKASGGQPKDFLESYFHALGLASGHLDDGTKYWVDKTLSYEYLFYRYIEWWPEARFIHMIRDPRDVYASYKARDIKNKRPVVPIDSFALTWGDSVHTLLDSQCLVAPDRRCVLRYEDLVSDVQATMQQIAHFLGIEFSPGLLSPTKGFGRVPWGGNAVSGIKQNVVFHDATDKWSHILSPCEVTYLEGLLHREMLAVGYELSRPVQRDALLSVKLLARRAFFRVINWGL